MRSLQIRNLPEDVYDVLSFRARRNHRSLAQQAVFELRAVMELRSREQRGEVIDALKKMIEKGMREVGTVPEDLIREDRER